MEDGGDHDGPLLEDCTAAAVGSLPLLSSHSAQAAGPEAGDGPGSVTLTISAMTMMSMMLISSQARLRGPTLATCQLGEVASTPPMQKGAASEPSPANAHGVQGLLADLQQDSAAPFALPGAHDDMHAPLVGCCAALTRNGLDDLGLFAILAVDQMADVDNAVYAGVGALQAGVVGLYGFVVILGRRVRGVR
jgi:hypothetical protein